MHRLIDRYRIRPGEHCGSASMRGLLAWYADLELPEVAIFGLGAGLSTALCRDLIAAASDALFAASREDLASHWDEAARRIEQVVEIESELFERLAATAG